MALSKDKKLYHGPANIGGIGGYAADYQRAQGYASDFIVWLDHTNRRNNHRNLRIDECGFFRRWLKIALHFFSAAFRYDVFNFYGGQSLLPWNVDLPFLKLLGKKVVMTHCGSEIRLMAVEETRNPYASLLDRGQMKREHDERKIKAMKRRNRWVDRVIACRNLRRYAEAGYDAKKIVSDVWINNCFTNLLEPDEAFAPRARPRIVHAPSNPEVKGTPYIEQALDELKRDGVAFEYLKLEKVPSAEAQKIYRDCDIIIDQLLVGGFGNLAVEGMYYAKPVVAYIIPEIADAIPDLPIVNASVDTVKETLRRLVENPDERARAGKRGREFYRKHFAPDALQEKLLKLYADLYDAGEG